MKLTPTITRELGLPRTLRDLLLELLAVARGKGHCVISHVGLADRLGVSKKTITRGMIALREMGLIETERTTRSRDRYRGADRVILASGSWSIMPVGSVGLRDKMSPRSDQSWGSECPSDLGDKMSPPIEDSSKGAVRDHESGHREGDVSGSEPAQPVPANDHARLTLIPGGRAA